MFESATRRGFLGATGAVLAASALPSFAAAQSKREMFPVAATTSGKVRGMDYGGVVCFRGIPYGAPTGGRNRYMPPRKPAPWKDVRDAFAFGQMAPQFPADASNEFIGIIEWDKQNGGMGEDCLVLNVWTPGLKDGRKRPVFVSFHGGGFTSGSSSSPGFHGDPLARWADAVVVTVNHRLASFGFTHLGDIAGPQFGLSGTVGMLDLQAALEWVRDNIENFGGDPGTVMIFGQSGGGRKVSAMLAMPGAKGLFHRAAVQSGSVNRLIDREAATRNARAVLKALDIAPANAARLQDVPMFALLAAQEKAVADQSGGSFLPVVDGVAIPQHPFEPNAPAASADVPVIIGTTLDESASGLKNFDLDDAGLRAYCNRRFGEANGARVLEVYRRAYPAATPFLVQARIDTQLDRRTRALRQASQKAALGKAPTYLYRFDAPAPTHGGRYGAVHGIDTSLPFHNAMPTKTAAPTPELLRLRDEMAGCWLAFAKTGDPNHKGIPRWPVFEPARRTTMLFGIQTRAVDDPDREIVKLHEEIGAGQPRR